MLSKNIELLNRLLLEIEKTIPLKDKMNIKISKSNIGWQLDHTLKVVNSVCTILAKKHSKKYKKNFNLLRSVLFTLGYIPRGKAKAPKFVNEQKPISSESLYEQLNNAKTHLKRVESLSENAYFIHHAFGTLSKNKTIRFLEIHTKHHLKIVNDILNK